MPHSSPLRIGVFGAGALGLYLAGRLARAGYQVTLIVRPGPRFPLPLVIDENGRSEPCDGITVAATWDAEPQDLLIVAVKAHQLPAALPEMQAWTGPNTQLLMIQNGLPWWYFLTDDGAHAGRRLRASDPDGSLLRTIDLRRTIACVVHKSAERQARNHVVAVRARGDRFILGRPLGGDDEILRIVIGTLRRAGLPAELCTDLRPAIWEKLLGNVVLNPLSAITGADLAGLLANPATRKIILKTMQEAYAVASAFGIRPATSPEERLERIAAVAARGTVRTSMLQDRLAGKLLEIEPIVGAVRELARLKRVATPHLNTLYACATAISATIAGQVGNPESSTANDHSLRKIA